MNKIKTVFSGFIQNMMFNVIAQYLIALLPISIFTGIYNFLKNKIPDSLIIYILISIIAILLTYIFINKKSRVIPHYPKIRCDYIFNKATFNLIYLKEENNYKCIRIIDYKALKKDLESIPGKYVWSGDETVKIKLLDSTNYELKLDNKKSHGVWNTFNVKLPQGVKKYRPYRFILEFTMTDSQKKMDSINTYTVEEPIDELILQVSIPCDRDIKSFDWFEYYNLNTERICADSGSDYDKTPDGNGYYVYSKTFKNPKLFYAYKISWNLS